MGQCCCFKSGYDSYPSMLKPKPWQPTPQHPVSTAHWDELNISLLQTYLVDPDD